MNRFLTILILAVTVGSASLDANAGTNDSALLLNSLTNQLLQAVGGQWEVSHGCLSGAKQIANGTWEFGCNILPHPDMGQDAVKAWEFRLFYCSAPCYVLAASSNLVLTAGTTNRVPSLERVARTLDLRPLTNAKPLGLFLMQDCAFQVEKQNPFRLKKQQRPDPTTGRTVPPEAAASGVQ